LVASFWIGNVILIILNVPLIGIWVKMLRVPYRFLLPSAMFFIAVGVFSTQNSLFHLWEVLAFGLLGALFIWLDFPVSPIVLGFVLGPMVEENFRRALIFSLGDPRIFAQRPISAAFLALNALLILGVTWSSIQRRRAKAKTRMTRAALPTAPTAGSV
jgi:TctA family transporter